MTDGLAEQHGQEVGAHRHAPGPSRGGWGRRPSNSFLLHPGLHEVASSLESAGPSGGWGGAVAGSEAAGGRSGGRSEDLGKAQGDL